MVYNGIVYEVKQFAQRDFLNGMISTKLMHQDFDTSCWQIGGSITS